MAFRGRGRGRGRFGGGGGTSFAKQEPFILFPVSYIFFLFTGNAVSLCLVAVEVSFEG